MGLGFTRLSAALATICLICAGLAQLAAEPARASDDAVATAPIDTGLTTGTTPAAASPEAERTRFLIGIDRRVEFSVSSLPNPNRVRIELPDIPLALPAEPGPTAVGVVKSFRAGRAGPGKTFIVIDVTEPVVIESAKIETAPDGSIGHLAVEIRPARAPAKAARKRMMQPPFGLGAGSLGAGDLQPPMPKRAVRPEELEKNIYKPTIVIDPGHGGDDTGAVKNGAVEKHVVLAFAKVLRDKIEKTGRYKVLMTRDDDTFVPLDERRAFGERHKAALFIAVHADYAGSNARGATIYSLRENVAKSLERSAKGEVSESVLSSSEVNAVKKAGADADVSAIRNILADLAAREVDVTRERTDMFSRSVIEFMGNSTSLRQKPDQQAAFRVLKTAQFPSVLIELAYVTNKEDAALLKSQAWREKVAESIRTAVDNYFSHHLARLPM